MEPGSDSEQYSDDSCEENDLVGSPQILERLERLVDDERMINDDTHPELRKKFEMIEAELAQRKSFNQSCFEMEVARIARWKDAAMLSVRKEAVRQQQELQESLISELDEKRRLLDVEKASMDLSVSGDVFDSKPTTTRKLRRRFHDNNNTATTPGERGGSISDIAGASAKRKKVFAPNPAEEIKYLLDDNDITEDLRKIFRHCGKPAPSGGSSASGGGGSGGGGGGGGGGSKRVSSGGDEGSGAPLAAAGPQAGGDEVSAYIDDGRLYYDNKWFTKGQAVVLQGKDASQHKFGAVITHVGVQELHLKRQTDLGKVKLTLQQLKAGKCTLRKRN